MKRQKNDMVFETILDRIPYYIFWKDVESVYLGCNQRFANLVGRKSPEEVIGKTDFELGWGKGEPEFYRSGDMEVMSGNAKINVEEILLRPDGSQIVMLVSKIPLRDMFDNCIGILGISTDITERKKMEADLLLSKEKAEAANKAKTEFLENMRHDIRTPLSGIIGFAELIKNCANDPKKVKEFAESLAASSYSLMELLNEILETIRVASGEIPIVKKKFNLKEKLENIVTLNLAKAAQKNLALSLEYDSRLPVYFIGDPTRIHRLILELVTNALNFTHKGFVQISATLVKKQENEVVVKIIVEDTGIGIPQEKQEEVFVRFKRLTPSYTGIYKGAGLGLEIVKQFVDDLRGELYIDSTPERGTKFTCVLPLQSTLLDAD